MQILHRHVRVLVDQLNAQVRLDISDEVHNVAELLLGGVGGDLSLLELENLDEEPLVEVIDARQAGLELKLTQLLLLFLLDRKSFLIAFIHNFHGSQQHQFFVRKKTLPVR